MTDDLRNLKKLFEFDERFVVDLGMRLPKGAKTTAWAVRRLTRQQLTYAATDA